MKAMTLTKDQRRRVQKYLEHRQALRAKKRRTMVLCLILVGVLTIVVGVYLGLL